MKLKHYPVRKLKKEILKIISKYLDLKKYQVFFFGSRVSGRASERSDIDIGIEGSKPIPLDVLAKIKEEIREIPTLYHLDVVDFKNIDQDFYKVARQNIELINSK